MLVGFVRLATRNYLGKKVISLDGYIRLWTGIGVYKGDVLHPRLPSKHIRVRMITLYDFAANVPNKSISPYAWRVRYDAIFHYRHISDPDL